jgi:hypothetical protein
MTIVCNSGPYMKEINPYSDLKLTLGTCSRCPDSHGVVNPCDKKVMIVPDSHRTLRPVLRPSNAKPNPLILRHSPTASSRQRHSRHHDIMGTLHMIQVGVVEKRLADPVAFRKWLFGCAALRLL